MGVSVRIFRVAGAIPTCHASASVEKVQRQIKIVNESNIFPDLNMANPFLIGFEWKSIRKELLNASVVFRRNQSIKKNNENI